MSELLQPDNLETAKNYFINYQIAKNHERNIFLVDTILGKAKSLHGPAGRICYKLEKFITNNLGIVESVFYYLTFRQDWFNGWAHPRLANIKQYANTPGITISKEIYDLIWRDIQSSILSAFVLVTGKGEIFYSKGLELDIWYERVGHFKDYRKRTLEVGIPRELFNQKDPYQ